MVVVPNNSILNQVQLMEDGKFEKWAGRARCSGVSKFFFPSLMRKIYSHKFPKDMENLWKDLKNFFST